MMTGSIIPIIPWEEETERVMSSIRENSKKVCSPTYKLSRRVLHVGGNYRNDYQRLSKYFKIEELSGYCSVLAWHIRCSEHVQISRKEALNGQGQKYDHQQSQKLLVS